MHHSLIMVFDQLNIALAFPSPNVSDVSIPHMHPVYKLIKKWKQEIVLGIAFQG